MQFQSRMLRTTAPQKVKNAWIRWGGVVRERNKADR